MDTQYQSLQTLSESRVPPKGILVKSQNHQNARTQKKKTVSYKDRVTNFKLCSVHSYLQTDLSRPQSPNTSSPHNPRSSCCSII